MQFEENQDFCNAVLRTFKPPEPLAPASWDFGFWTSHIWGQASIETVKAANRPNSRRKRRERKKIQDFSENKILTFCRASDEEILQFLHKDLKVQY